MKTTKDGYEIKISKQGSEYEIIIRGIALFRELTLLEATKLAKDLEKSTCGIGWNPASNAAAVMGRVKSDRKAASSRENGKLGGRPKKEK